MALDEKGSEENMKFSARNLAVVAVISASALIAPSIPALAATDELPVSTPTPASSPLESPAPTPTPTTSTTPNPAGTSLPTPSASSAPITATNPADRTTRIIIKYRDGVSTTMDAGKPAGWSRVKSAKVISGVPITDHMSAMNLGTSVDLAMARKVAAEVATDPTVEWAEPDQWRTAVADVAPRAATVDVTVSGTGGSATKVAAFTYVDGVPPTLAQTPLRPTSGSSAGGETVVISGGGLATTTSVTFGGIPAQSIVSRTDTAVTVLTPAVTSSTPVDVTVTTDSGTVTAPSAFTFGARTTPTITSVSPNSGQLGAGTIVTITGTQLTGTRSVKFGTSATSAVSATSISVISDTQVRVRAPSGTAGTKSIFLIAAAGSTSLPNAYTYVAPPLVSAFSPTSGSASGGTIVTITGRNLSNAKSVTFGGKAATITSNTASSITVTTPAGVVSTSGVPVSVVTAGGTSPSLRTKFRYVVTPASQGKTVSMGATSTAVRATALAPTISSLSATSGPSVGGTTVTITGTNLDAITNVTFGSAAATIMSTSSTSIVVTTPAEFVKSTPTETAFTNGTLWGLTGTFGINVNGAWSKTQGSSRVVVAVLDTGITTHTDLGSQVAGYDMIADPSVANDGDGRDANPSDPGDWVSAADSSGATFGGNLAGCGISNSSWHGTHVAGTINAAINGVGSVGIAPKVLVQPVRVLGKCGGYMSDIALGIMWAAGAAVPGLPVNATPANVITLSLGGGGACSATEQSAIDYAIGRGVTVTIAAGNEDSPASSSSPGNCNGVITVAATDSAGKRAWFSNYGPLVEIAAPGVGIYSTMNSGTTVPAGQTYVSWSGTSMATPHVAGVVALMLSRDKSLTPAQVLQRIQSTATAFGGTVCDADTTKTCGAGIINAGSAVQ